MKYILLFLTLFATVATSPLLAQAAYISQDENPTINTPLSDDGFLAGKNVSITAPIAGEVFAAGTNVSVTQRPERSLAAAGNVVTAEGAGYNAYIAGNTVVLAGEYGHDVYVAGRTVTIKPGTVIKGDLRVIATDVNLDGTVEGDVWVGGDMVVSSVIVGGNMSAMATNITFTGGSVAGNLTYESAEEAAGLSQVSVGGETIHREAPATDRSAQMASETFRGWFLKLLSSLVLGAMLILFFRRQTSEVVELTVSQWRTAWIVGILALILTPLLIAIFAITIIGWPIALLLLLAYIIALLAAPIYATLVVGRWILSRLGDKDASLWSALLVGVVVVAILKAIPFVGPLVTIVFILTLVVAAIGALLLWYRQKASH